MLYIFCGPKKTVNRFLTNIFSTELIPNLHRVTLGYYQQVCKIQYIKDWSQSVLRVSVRQIQNNMYKNVISVWKKKSVISVYMYAQCYLFLPPLLNEAISSKQKYFTYFCH